jgi:hypothetical protein
MNYYKLHKIRKITPGVIRKVKMKIVRHVLLVMEFNIMLLQIFLTGYKTKT